MNNRLTTEQIDAIKARRAAARHEISGLSNGKRKWTMCIPVHHTDSDRVFAASLDDIDALLADNAALRAAYQMLREEAADYAAASQKLQARIAELEAPSWEKTKAAALAMWKESQEREKGTRRFGLDILNVNTDAGQDID